MFTQTDRCKRKSNNIYHIEYWLKLKKDKKPKWQRTSELLRDLRTKCNAKKATMEDLKVMFYLLNCHLNEMNITVDYNSRLCGTSLQSRMSWDTYQSSRFFI